MATIREVATLANVSIASVSRILNDDPDYRVTPETRERVLAATFTLYDCVKNVEPLITVTGVERCLKRHFTYTRTIYKTKRSDYKFDYDYSTLSGAVDDAVSFGVECVSSVLDGKVDSGLFSRSFLEK